MTVPYFGYITSIILQANLILPLSKEVVMEFAIYYCCQGKEFWDNNNGQNYKISVSRTTFLRTHSDADTFL